MIQPIGPRSKRIVANPLFSYVFCSTVPYNAATMAQAEPPNTTRGKTAPQIFDAGIQNIKDFGNETRQLEFHFKPGIQIEFLAGQFVTLLHPHDGRVTKRAYSIASPPFIKDHIDICIKLVEHGEITNWLWGFKGEEQIKLQGPYGKFILPEKIDFEPVFVATGTGVAPFRSMIHALLKNGFREKLTLVFGVRYEDMIPYEDEWRALQKRHPNFVYAPTISRPGAEWKGETGYVQTLLGKYAGDPKGKRIYICGLNNMIQAVKETALKLSYAPTQIFYERYD